MCRNYTAIIQARRDRVSDLMNVFSLVHPDLEKQDQEPQWMVVEWWMDGRMVAGISLFGLHIQVLLGRLLVCVCTHNSY